MVMGVSAMNSRALEGRNRVEGAAVKEAMSLSWPIKTKLVFIFPLYIFMVEMGSQVEVNDAFFRFSFD